MFTPPAWTGKPELVTPHTVEETGLADLDYAVARREHQRL